MIEPDDLVRSTTRAIAGTVRDVPPLRLSPAQDEVLSFTPKAGRTGRTGRVRRVQGWLVPAAAAAVVLAVAVSLVAIRDISNGPVASPGASEATVGVPSYYVTLSSRPGPQVIGKKNSAPNDLVVGDARTGRQLTTLTPPRGSTFFGVTAAADDRTFVVDTLPLGSAFNPEAARTWYLLRLAPDGAAPARLTRLAVPRLANVSAIALSGSGAELAVATGGGAGELLGLSIEGILFPPGRPGVLRIYSVSTGKLLRTWSTSDKSVFGGAPGLYSEDNIELTWVDADHAIAFSSTRVAPAAGRGTSTFTDHESVRVLDVTRRSGDLLADSRVAWSQTESSPSAGSSHGCTFELGELVVADGKAIICPSVTAPRGSYHPGQHVTVRWLTYSTAAPTVARLLETVTIPVTQPGAFTLDEEPLSAPSPAIMAAWGFFGDNNHAAAGAPVDVVSEGKFRPLPVKLPIGNRLLGIPSIVSYGFPATAW
jgi:hypothetical protein